MPLAELFFGRKAPNADVIEETIPPKHDADGDHSGDEAPGPSAPSAGPDPEPLEGGGETPGTGLPETEEGPPPEAEGPPGFPGVPRITSIIWNEPGEPGEPATTTENPPTD